MVALFIKYRPTKFEEVVGQQSTIRSLRKVLKAHDSQAFLLTGPSGVGKTTIGRIIATEVGCRPENLIEIDAGTYTGVDSMRQLQDGLQYRAFGESDIKVAIVDETHMLSKSAFNSLLKFVEEPPAHVYWVFCTTEPGRIPQTIKTRCTTLALRLVPDKELGVLFDDVCEAENINLPGDVGDAVIREAHGSARQMLVNLSMCRDVKTKKEATAILKSALESEPVLELCRFIVKGGSWIKAMSLLERLHEENPESIRIVIMNYLSTVAKGSGTDKQAAHALMLMQCFETSYNPSERLAPLIMSLGRALLAE